MKYDKKNYCRNCHFPLPYKAKFCPQCGEKTNDGKVTVWSLLQQVWFRVLHLESRSLRLLGHLLIPGRASLEFFRGRRRRYPPPIRFFFLIMFLFLFTLNHLVGTDGMRIQTNRSGVRLESDTVKRPRQKDFYALGQRYTDLLKMRRAFDSLPENLRTPLAREALDSLLLRTHGPATRKINAIMAEARESGSTGSLDSMSINLGFKHIRIASYDLFQMDADGLIQKYGIRGWMDQTLLRQGVKALKEPDSLMKSYLGSLAWTILALVALMSFVLTLMYWRQKRYYVEHFIFLLNEHSSAFLLLTAAFWIYYFLPFHWSMWAVLAGWLMISPVIAMRRFYGQGMWLTLFKSLVFSITYLLGFSVLFTVGMLIVFVLF